MAHLRALDCEIGQGYFFSKAVDEEMAAALISGPAPWELSVRPAVSGR